MVLILYLVVLNENISKQAWNFTYIDLLIIPTKDYVLSQAPPLTSFHVNLPISDSDLDRMHTTTNNHNVTQKSPTRFGGGRCI